MVLLIGKKVRLVGFGVLLGTMSVLTILSFDKNSKYCAQVAGELVALNNSVNLAHRIANQLGLPVVYADAQRFADGEANVLLDTTLLLNKKAILIAGTHPPVHENIINLTLAAFMLKQAGITDIIAVVPYFGYSRQDKGFLPEQPGPAQLIIKLLESAGITHCIALELHAEKIMNHFSIQVDNVYADEAIVEHIRETFFDPQKICIVAPDHGALARARRIAKKLGTEVVVFGKKRSGADQTSVVRMEGSCEDKIAILVDDIIDTGGTAIQACKRLKERGAEEVYGYFFHPVLSRNAAQRIQESEFDGIFVSNSIPMRKKDKVEKIKVFDVSGVLADALAEIL